MQKKYMQTRHTSFAFLFLAALSLMIFLPFADAFATVTDVGSQAKRLADQIYQVPKLIAVACYVIGTFFAARSLLALKGFIENVDDTPVTKFLSLASTGALLIMLPYIIEVMVNSLDVQTAQISSTSDSFAQ